MVPLPRTFVIYKQPPSDYLSERAEQVVALIGKNWEQFDRIGKLYFPVSVVVVTSYVPVTNSSSTPEITFSVKAKELKGLGNVVGFIHSHEKKYPKPSLPDIKGIPEGLIGGVWCDENVIWYANHGTTGFVTASQK